MKSNIKKAGILLGIFLVSLAVFFITSQRRVEEEETVYTEIGEPTLPVIYPVVYGEEINCLHGYLQDMGNETARDSITVLPENRALELQIYTYGSTVGEISYEIRNLSLDRLVEQTQIQDWSQEGDQITAVLPIDYVINQNETYLLKITVQSGEKEIYYYTRIVWPDHTYAQDMIALAKEFSVKTLDYNQARDLVTYLETSSTEDNSSLGHVTIRTSFDHLTWNGLDVEMYGEPELVIKDLDGIMGQIQVSYQVVLTDSQGNESLVDVEDNYTMKWDVQRIYMMNYERYANEHFTGDRSQLSGKRILLGITNSEEISSLRSPDSNYIVFKIGRDLWRFDQKGNDFLKIFSFSGESQDIRSDFKNHGIEILQADNAGNVDFLVYGYMNRGKYEGRSGVVFYHYQQENNCVNERFFLPAQESFEQMKEDVEQLAYIGANNMFYLLLDGTVYGIDLNSSESLAVAQGLSQGMYAVSQDQSHLAWLEGGGPYTSSKLQLMDLNTSQKQEISGAAEDYVQVLGFVGNDLVYGFARENDQWMENGRLRDFPMYGVYIMGENMEVVSSYQTEGTYISNVAVEGGRIHMDHMTKVSDGTYMFQSQDTIVCNEEIGEDSMKGIGWYASEDKGRVYFVEADHSITPVGIEIESPSAFSFDDSAELEPLGSHSGEKTPMFSAYGGGHYIGSSRNFQEAVNMAYDQMGQVVNENQYLVWDRVNRSPIVNIKDPEAKADQILQHIGDLEDSYVDDNGLMMIDAKGCTLNQILYFIDKGYPVIAYTGNDGYVLLSGYDQYNVTIYDPVLKQSQKMGLNDAAAYFESLENDFVCGRMMEKR